jgi:HEAT repeat protein
LGQAAEPLLADITGRLKDPHPMVRLRAAEFLGVLGHGEPLTVLYDVLNTVPSEAEALLTLNTVVYLRDHRGLDIDTSRLQPRFTGGQVARRLEYLKQAASR